MKLSDKQRKSLWAAWFIAVGLVTFLSLLPGEAAPVQFLSQFSDKALHFAGYVILGLVPVLIARRKLSAFLAVFSMIVLGLALEFGQLLVPGRSFDLRDFVADDLGVLCGVAVGFCLFRRVIT